MPKAVLAKIAKDLGLASIRSRVKIQLKINALNWQKEYFMKVVKFGNFLADGAAYEKVVKIIQDDPERTVIVTSAPGKRFQGDIKVTDLLIRYAN